ncbi:MAG: hypothetical protein ACK5P5_00910 [Pseudobdellovibrionaceae bacterium]
MKYVILVFLSFLTACASQSNNRNTLALSYDRVFQLHVGSTTETDVVKIFGKPSARVQRNGYYILDYHSPQNGFQRLSLSFDNKNSHLSSLLWIPSEDEKEISLDGAKATFKESTFKVSEEGSHGSHAVSKIILYTDDSKGVTIRYNPSSNVVEAIAKYDANLRAPSATK